MEMVYNNFKVLVIRKIFLIVCVLWIIKDFIVKISEDV